ncbi:hypothetical protein EJ08DRAFT_212795 [Tothia fuscella]|uniref:C2H2-type domain-containing protein n=1 Tax=Tothia fuscella TaxID=1048955 RepID=A0A9P4TZF3_9PEZI|nr:hypothetical protein EJ08DRAFT_212795 [Tothia fuscella]
MSTFPTSKRNPSMGLLRVDTKLAHHHDHNSPMGELLTPESSICDGRRSSIASSHYSFESIGSLTSSHPSSVSSYSSTEPSTPLQHGLPMHFSFIATGTPFEDFSLTSRHQDHKPAYPERQMTLRSSPPTADSAFDFRPDPEWEYLPSQRQTESLPQLSSYANDRMMPASGDFASAVGACMNHAPQTFDQHAMNDPFSYPRYMEPYQTSAQLGIGNDIPNNFQYTSNAVGSNAYWPTSLGAVLPSSTRFHESTIEPKETVIEDAGPEDDAYLDESERPESGMVSPCNNPYLVKDEESLSDQESSWGGSAAGKRVVNRYGARFISRYGAKGLKKEDSTTGCPRRQQRSGPSNRRRAKDGNTQTYSRNFNGARVKISIEQSRKSLKYACGFVKPDGTLCLSAFVRVEHLKRHTGTHNGEKPYICPVRSCSKGFGRRDNWRDHLRTHLSETQAGRNDRIDFEELKNLLMVSEEEEEAKKTIRSLSDWKASGGHLLQKGTGQNRNIRARL